MSRYPGRFVIACGCLGLLAVVAFWQTGSSTAEGDGRGPIAAWSFATDQVRKGQVVPQAGKLTATLVGQPTMVDSPVPAIEFRNEIDALLVEEKVKSDATWLPREALSLTAWVRIDVPGRLGCVASLSQHHHDRERGFFLGYNEHRFRASISAEGQDVDAPAALATSKNRYQRGRWYHVAMTYDGAHLKLYVNGRLDSVSQEASGSVRYPGQAPFQLGRYADEYEQATMQGAIQSVALYDRSLSAKEVETQFTANRALAERPPVEPSPHFVVTPYLQFPTRDTVTILWETSHPGRGTVSYGTMTPPDQTTKATSEGVLQEVRLTGLQPNTRYFYQVRTDLADGSSLTSEVRTLHTAVDPQSVYSFALIGDTQKNPDVTGRVARLAWARRPHFVLHLGDVVDAGPDKREWEEELFRPCASLLGRVPIFPAIGNHEKDHENYYRYFALPQPEYYYRFRYGNADFFVVDSNRSLLPGSEQYTWLDRELAKSDATWKFAYHHHPVYSSDDNDYGDTWRGDSTYGEMKVRPVAALYEKHNVDMAFNGHIHVYERSWPIRAGKIDPRGVVYVTSGGGGGRLENFAPTPTWFKAQTRADYHFCLVNVHLGRLQFQAFDHRGRLFDSVDMSKSMANGGR